MRRWIIILAVLLVGMVLFELCGHPLDGLSYAFGVLVAVVAQSVGARRAPAASARREAMDL